MSACLNISFAYVKTSAIFHNVMIDAIDNNDITDNTANNAILPPVAIHEFLIISNNFSAEYVRNVGGVFECAY